MEPEHSTQTTLRPAQILAVRLGVSYHPPDSPSLPGTLAFETIRGEAGVDFIGTDSVDALFSLNETGAITVDAKGGNDTITLQDSDQVVGTATIKGGAGNDTIALTAESGGNNSRLSASSVNGGQGDDTFNLAGSVSTTFRGNEEDDDFVLAQNYTNSTVNGNTGEDSFAIGAGFQLSNSKILGGNDNDGSMNFGANPIVSAVDSTINGSKGNDSITIGAVTLATNFTVFGGQGNDVITSTNGGSDNVVYSGDKGDDQITTRGAQDSVLGGEGNDLIATGADADTIDAGAGEDIVTDGAGADTIDLGSGDDTYNDAGGDDTITGGAGADTYNPAGGENVYVIGSTADSAATISGTDRTFDSMTVGFAAATDTFDISAMAESLTGDANPNSVVVSAAVAVDVASFAALRTFMANGATLTASGTTARQVEVTTITVTDGSGAATNIDGTYLIVNNTNNVLDSGDMMFQIDAADLAQYQTFNNTNAAASAWAL